MASMLPGMLEHWNSGDVDPGIRLDYWHDVAHNWVDAQLLTPADEMRASWSLLRGQDCLFGTKRSTAYAMRTGPQHVPPGEDMVVISLLEHGQMRVNGAPGEHQHLTAGMLGLYAPRQVAHYQFGDGAHQTYFALPRSAAVQALGREPRNLQLAPQRCALAPMLSSQLVHLGQLVRRGAMNEAEYAGALDATRALALLMLRNLGRQGDGADLPDAAQGLHAGRHAAALRFMQQHAQRHDLDVAVIAHAAGCSRTRLYEAFAAQGQTPMDALRELRLQRARQLLEHDPHLHVGVAAWRCGFADPSGFGKLFKARFGHSPSEWRWKARAQ